MLALREWSAEQRQSRLSAFWPLVQPLSYTALFVLLRPLFGGAAASDMSRFALYVFIGFSLWQSWFEAMRAQMDALRRHKGLMSRGELTFGALFTSTVLGSLFALVPRLVVAAISAALVFGPAQAGLPALVGFGLLILLNGAAIGALLQPFSTLSPDLGKTIQSLSLALMVTGAVFVPLPESPPHVVVWLLDANPMGTLLQAARSGMYGSHPGGYIPVIAWTVVTSLLMLLLPAFGRKALPIVVERLGN